ncbi:MAG: hypothetical protein QOE35_2680 [Actinomycetota bacterium]|jgi:hypothetical protein
MVVSAATSVTYAQVVESWVGRVLPPSFRRRTIRWVRPSTADVRWTSVIEVNRRRLPPGEDFITFTVEWGIFVAGYPERAWGMRGGVGTARGAMAVRVPMLFTDEDVWWDVRQRRISRRGLRSERVVTEDDSEMRDLLGRLMPLADREWTIGAVVDWLEESDHKRRWGNAPTPEESVTDVLRWLDEQP